MSTATTLFMGIPVEHDGINKSRHDNVDQWDGSKFEELLRPILDVGVEVRWDQYTPYFNDGDICEFYVNEPRFHTPEVGEEDGDDEDGFIDTYDVRLKGGKEVTYERRQDSKPNSWGYVGYTYVEIPTGREFPVHPAFGLISAFASAMNRGHFEEFLYDVFGDHAKVTVNSEKVVKEFYDHD